MPTARTAAVVAPGTIMFTTPLHQKGKLSSVTIDNQSGALRTITLRDDFTTNVGVVNPAAAQTITKGQWSIGAGLTAAVPKDELEKKEFLGVCRCIADAAFATCIITMDYELE